jgi:hypothetical protein
MEKEQVDFRTNAPGVGGGKRLGSWFLKPSLLQNRGLVESTRSHHHGRFPSDRSLSPLAEFS